MEEDFCYRKTRKIHLWFYVAVLILVAYYVWVRIQGDGLKLPILIAGIVFIVLGFKIVETSRLYNLYGFNSQYVFHRRGIFKRRLKKVFLGRISDLVLDKSLINRIFNYGNVFIHHFGGSGVIEVKKINKPHQFIEDLQEKIKEYKVGI